MIPKRESKKYTPRPLNYGSSTKTPHKKHRKESPKKVTPSAVSTWRDSNDYREQYFERNHGIGGYGYICSQCFRPMFRKSKIQVDHIIPPSRFAVKKRRRGQWVKTSIMARFLNQSFNCAAICPDCNRRKSDAMDFRVLRGYMMKSLEVAFNIGQILISIPIMAVALSLFVGNKLLSTVFRRLRPSRAR